MRERREIAKTYNGGPAPPETGEFEAVSGNSQFGRCRDDWGNWFGNNNSNPMYHYGSSEKFCNTTSKEDASEQTRIA